MEITKTCNLFYISYDIIPSIWYINKELSKTIRGNILYNSEDEKITLKLTERDVLKIIEIIIYENIKSLFELREKIIKIL